MQTDAEGGVIREIDQWFFEHYLLTWESIGNSESRNPKEILDYWNVPMHAASVHMNKWLLTEKAVLGRLCADHKPLRSTGYTRTNVVDRRTVVYNDNAASVDVIWSRCRQTIRRSNASRPISKLIAQATAGESSASRACRRRRVHCRRLGECHKRANARQFKGAQMLDDQAILEVPGDPVGRPRRAGTESEENKE
jgi:hypothetical protein